MKATDSSTPSTDLSGAAPGSTAKEVQRSAAPKVGQYLCQKCQNQFDYAGGELQCPQCHAKKADNLTPIYTEETPGTEMLDPDDFPAAD